MVDITTDCGCCFDGVLVVADDSAVTVSNAELSKATVVPAV